MLGRDTSATVWFSTLETWVGRRGSATVGIRDAISHASEYRHFGHLCAYNHRCQFASYLKLHRKSPERFFILENKTVRRSKTRLPELPKIAHKAREVAFANCYDRRFHPLSTKNRNGGTHEIIEKWNSRLISGSSWHGEHIFNFQRRWLYAAV